MNYNDELNDRATALVAHAARSLDVADADVYSGIDWNQTEANATYFSRLITAKVITTANLKAKRKAAVRDIEIAAQLGGVPKSATQLMALYADQHSLTVNWSGQIRGGDGKSRDLADIQLDLRTTNDDLRLGFVRPAVDDAARKYQVDQMKERPAALDAALSQRRPFDWDALARAFIGVTDEMSHDLNVAVMKKFAHQVRRKLRGLPVTNHIMPVLHGSQGCGKTYLLRAMLAPLDEATAWSDFDQVTDVRNIELWQRLVIVLDEMAKAGKADIETVKHVITADTLDRRPMYSNRTTPIDNHATLIGASNHRIDELVRDETGNRRFVELIYHRAPNAKVEDFDFVAMWMSIQPEDADPIAPLSDELKAAQAQYATLGPVEDWLEHADTGHWNGQAKTEWLYASFCDHRRAVTAGHDYQARTMNAFSSELRRVADNRRDLGVRKLRTAAGVRWTRDTRPTTAQVKAAQILSFGGDA